MSPQPLASPSVDAARSLPVLLVATIDGPTAVPHGIDWVRIDGASGTLETIERRRDASSHAVLFDVPGPDTRHRDTLLTTTEFLVFAAAADFEWVNLRGMHSAEDVLHAREFLPDSVRLSVTLSTPRSLRHALRPLCEVADALLFDREELRHSLGSRRTDAMLASAVRHASDRGTPHPARLRRPTLHATPRPASTSRRRTPVRPDRGRAVRNGADPRDHRDRRSPEPGRRGPIAGPARSAPAPRGHPAATTRCSAGRSDVGGARRAPGLARGERESLRARRSERGAVEGRRREQRGQGRGRRPGSHRERGGSERTVQDRLAQMGHVVDDVELSPGRP